MKNSIGRRLYHSFVVWAYRMKTFRGGWILTHFYINDYKEHRGSYLQIAKAHLKGWSYFDWKICNISNKNKNKYLSTRDYCSLHPINGIYSQWIDDKLILKYILNGTNAGDYLPQYYFHIESDGKILKLMDADDSYSNDAESIIKMIENKGILAFKLIRSSLGIGFYKVEYKNNTYYLNNEIKTKKDILNIIYSLRGYIVQEYLSPHKEFAKYCNKSVGCLRILVAKKKDGAWIPVVRFMRFGTNKSNAVDNYARGGVLVFLDENGKFSRGNVFDEKNCKNMIINKHPDTNLPLVGSIPHWDVIIRATETITKELPQLSYLGIDFCITSNEEIKILEINSLGSLDALQFEGSLFDREAGQFFKERLSH